MKIKDYNKLKKVIDDLTKLDRLGRTIKTIDIHYDKSKISGFTIKHN